ncbi:hypothetical protein ABX042_13935 [Snodgrassella alvi]|uniref:hypothetical protein n=1 Tax=Snodgrassella alvi TaxID=1196083 RepID=UPI00345F5257
MDYQAVVAQLLNVEGALAAAVVDYDNGMLMAGNAINKIDLEIAAASSTEVIRSKIKTMQMLDLSDEIEDILITQGHQYHLIRPLKKLGSLFLYSVLDSHRANLALSRRALIDVEKQMEQ